MQKPMLDAMTNMMAAGKELGASKGVNVFAVAMDEAEGIDALEKLQEHENEEVYSKAVHLLETYFGAEEEEDENLAPNATSSGFAFGLAAPPAVNAAFGQPAAQPAFAFTGERCDGRRTRQMDGRRAAEEGGRAMKVMHDAVARDARSMCEM